MASNSRNTVASEADRLRLSASLKDKTINPFGGGGSGGGSNDINIYGSGGTGVAGGTPSGYGAEMKPGGQIAPVGTAFVDFLNAVGAAKTGEKYVSPYFSSAVYGSTETPGYEKGDFRAYVQPLEDKKKKKA